MSQEWMPGATHLPIREATEQGSYVKTQLIYHSTGTRAGARANRRYFDNPNESMEKVRVESTFIIDYDGEILQIMPASAKADANMIASRRAISVEVVGTADEPYTPAQMVSCIDIARWACTEHPIARRVIPREPLSGIGWHVMFGAPGPWTTVSGKECPGPQRILQVKNVIIPATQRLDLPLPPVETEDEVASFLFHDGNKTYWRDGGDTIWVPEPEDAQKLAKAGVKHLGQLSPEMTARLVAAAQQ